jgi:hypothetical protein
MSYLRRISTRRLLVLCAAVVALVSGVTAIALAATGGGPKPPPKPLAEAVHDALAAAPVQGVSARIQFTNHLVDSSSVVGGDPILSGATGRLWAAGDRLRIELQSDGGGGDAQVLLNGRAFSVYDVASQTVYRGKLPVDKPEPDSTDAGGVPSLARVQDFLTRLAGHATLSAAEPSDVAGRPAYTVRISPRHDGGLLGGAELAWDAVHGVPLRAAVYAAGSAKPVLELRATSIDFGPVASSVFDVAPPAGARVVDLAPPSDTATDGEPVTGLDAVRARLPFALAAPDTLVGLPRREVRLISVGDRPAALVTYGRGLGGIGVVESAPDGASAPDSRAADAEQGLKLPKISINGVSGDELDTALGTVVRFQRGGVAYTVLGSVPPAAAEAAARAL